MLAIALASLLVFAVMQVVDREKYVDGFTSITFVLAPAILVLLLRALGAAFDIPAVYLYAVDSLYIFVPLLLLKAMTEYSWRKCIGYALLVAFIVFLSQLAIGLLLG